MHIYDHFTPYGGFQKVKCFSNQAITEIENFFDWVVGLRVESEVAARKKVTSFPGAIALLSIYILTPNKLTKVLDLMLILMIYSRALK